MPKSVHGGPVPIPWYPSAPGHHGFYSCIQVIPDSLRLDAATFGVLMACPELDLLNERMIPADGEEADRIAGFFGLEPSSIETMRATVLMRQRIWQADLGSMKVRSPKKKKAEWYKYLTAEFGKMFFGVIQFSPLRPMAIGDPEESMKELYRGCARWRWEDVSECSSHTS